MSRNSGYLQFPLSSLAFGETEQERLEAILDYCVVTAGLKLWSKAHPDTKAKFERELLASQTRPVGFNRTIPRHFAVMFGASLVGARVRNIEIIINNHARLEVFLKAFEARRGRDCIVRIRTDWVFNARDHKGLTYREFVVLCAIFSCIGSKKLARVTQPRVRRCTQGYRTEAIMLAELPNRADETQLLTERQVRDTIDRLHRNKFFARCTYARRYTYYSIRFSNEELRKHVVEMLSYRHTHRIVRKAQDDDLTETVRRRRAESGTNS